MSHLSQRKPGFGKPRKTGYKSSVRNLDVIRFTLNFPTFLPDGVMAAQVTLTHLVMVRIHVGQPNCRAIWMTDRDENLGSTKRSGEGTRAAWSQSDAAAAPIHVGQPFDAPQNAACSWPAAGAIGGIWFILRTNRRGEGLSETPGRFKACHRASSGCVSFLPVR